MKIEGGAPQCGRGALFLGVRVGPGEKYDINPDDEGFVSSGQGGMSVAPSLMALPPHRLPVRLRHAYPDRFPAASGTNNAYCWSMGEGAFVAGPLAASLSLRLDPDNMEKHGFVEPDGKMILEEYESALTATKEKWRRWEE